MAFCNQGVLLLEPAIRPVSSSKTSWSPIATPSDRRHPKGGAQAKHPPWRRAGRHRVARTFEAPWRVDGDRAAWRRAVESKPNRGTEAQSFLRQPCASGKDKEATRGYS